METKIPWNNQMILFSGSISAESTTLFFFQYFQIQPTSVTMIVCEMGLGFLSILYKSCNFLIFLNKKQ